MHLVETRGVFEQRGLEPPELRNVAALKVAAASNRRSSFEHRSLEPSRSLERRSAADLNRRSVAVLNPSLRRDPEDLGSPETSKRPRVTACSP